MFTETASVVPGVRVTVKVSLSTLPIGIVTLVAPPFILPFVTVIGTTISNGAPVGATALNPSTPTFSNDTGRGNGSTVFPPRESVVSEVSPSKMPSGRLLKSLLFRLSVVKDVRLSNMPADKDTPVLLPMSNLFRAGRLENAPVEIVMLLLLSISKLPKTGRLENAPVEIDTLLLLLMKTLVNADRLENVPAEIDTPPHLDMFWESYPERDTLVSAMSPSKSPAFNANVSFPLGAYNHLRLVIAARCASVT